MCTSLLTGAVAAAAGLLLGLDYILGGRKSHGIFAMRRCLSLFRRIGK